MVFVHHDARKLREWASEQCGHVYLIVEVDKSKIGSADAFAEELVNEFGCVFIWGLVHCVVEIGAGDEGLNSFHIGGYITQSFSLLHAIHDDLVTFPSVVAIGPIKPVNKLAP